MTDLIDLAIEEYHLIASEIACYKANLEDKDEENPLTTLCKIGIQLRLKMLNLSLKYLENMIKNELCLLGIPYELTSKIIDND